jgi:hypothetical protein
MTAEQTRTQFAGDTRNWIAGSILAASVLEPLHELNRVWLGLLARAPRRWGTSPTGLRLPDPACAGLASMPVEGRAEIARCPFSLFTARFSDGLYWVGAAGNAQALEHAVSDAGAPADEALSEFTQIALFFTWHLVRANPSSAKIVLGMSDQTMTAFLTLSLTAAQRIARYHMGLVSARWPERTWFWLRLCASAGRKDLQDEVRTLGLQMLAAELAGANGREVSARHPTKG